MSNSSEYSEESGLNEKQIANIIKYLNSAFSSACYAYRKAKRGTRVVNFLLRDLKTHKPILSDDTDYTLYHAQIEFSYLIDEIQRGPAALASIEVKKCNDLIDSLSVT